MAKEKKILTAFQEEMQRHNSVKRRINLIGQIMAWGWVVLFVILALYVCLCPIMDQPRPLIKIYQYEEL